ncbi:MAG: flippase-like domain-containing protein, partial [Alphaproteobacteria bacterium]|nr:flippase-like domain-containing protein [Alphaproteobacteria bacterium]
MKVLLRYVSIALRLAVSVGAIWFVSDDIDGAALGQVLQRIDAIWLTTALAVLALQPVLGTLRWQIVMSGLQPPPPLTELGKITYVSLFFNQILPASVGGDVIRIVLASRAGARLRDAFASTALDRAFMLLALIAMFAVSVGLLNAGPEVPKAYIDVVIALTVLVFTGFFVVGFNLLPIWRVPLPFFDRLEGPALQARSVLRKPRVLGTTFVVSLLSHLNIVASVYMFLLSLGAMVTFAQVLVLMPLVLLAAVLP